MQFANLPSCCNRFVLKGNEVYIDEIAAKLKNIFRSRSYEGVHCHELRKITFLLMLNTDVSLSRDLNEDFSVCHLLNNFPQLSKCLLINLIWQLKFENYFYESVKFSPSWFMLQFLEEAIDSLRFSKPLDIIAQVKHMIESIYYNICRMDYKTSSSSQQVEQKIILNKLFDLVMSLLRNYNTPNADDDIAKSKKKLKTYLGHSLNLQLTLVHSCLAMFRQKPSFRVNEELQIYKLMAEKEPEVDNLSTKSYSPVVEEMLMKINIALLNTLQNTVVSITLDDFVYWVEIDIEDPSTVDEDLKRDNLQKSVGEQCFSLIQLINENERFEHNIVGQLETIAIKPKTLQEIANAATVGTVLDKIENSPSKRVWLEELLSRVETLYSNSECLQTVIDSIALIEFKDLKKILNDHQVVEDIDREEEMQIKEIFRLASEKLNNLELRDFTEELVRVFGVDYNLQQDEDDTSFSSELTNYFNKLTENDLDEHKMWQLIMSHPSKFFESLLASVATQDKTQINITLRILSETNSIATDYIKDLVLTNIETTSESSKSLNHIFLAGLFKLNLMDRKEFVRDVLMENLAKALSADKMHVTSMLLSALRQISARLKVEDLLPPLTILVAQILDKHRWDLMSYSQLKESIVESSIEVLQDLVKAILMNGNKKDKDWILAKIIDFKPMTKFYLQKFSLEKGESITTFDKFLHLEGFVGAPKSKITSFLCETIVRCTTKEVKWLMTNEQLQPFITDALLVITVIVSKANQQGALNCLHKCVSDYVKILNDVIIPTSSDKQSLLANVLKLIKKFPSNSYEELTILFIDSIKTFRDCENFASSVAELDDCEMKKVFQHETSPDQ